MHRSREAPPERNWTASLGEDVAVVGGLWAALYYPWVFLVGLALFVALMVWLTPKIVRGVRRLFSRGGVQTPTDDTPSADRST